MATRTMLLVTLVLPLAFLAAAQKRVPGEIPLPRTSPTSGQEMYRAYCADCHGEKGKGDGPVVPVLKVVPPDLTTLEKSVSCFHVCVSVMGADDNRPLRIVLRSVPLIGRDSRCDGHSAMTPEIGASDRRIE